MMQFVSQALIKELIIYQKSLWVHKHFMYIIYIEMFRISTDFFFKKKERKKNSPVAEIQPWKVFRTVKDS